MFFSPRAARRRRRGRAHPSEVLHLFFLLVGHIELYGVGSEPDRMRGKLLDTVTFYW